ncbi:MAG: hypothetical protein HQ513_16160 [Rhodospirillales bacterium]|nr:hypothetical protein [Rhodospirillales bacterium]
MINRISYIFILMLALAALPVSAQGLNFGNGDSDSPIEVYADDGIEWQQDALTFVARGNARAVRGEVTVFGDELHAFYRKLPDGGTEIWRLDAIRNVRIVTPSETASGDKGVYDIDNGILVLTGKKVRLVTPTDEVTANEQLEYWERKQMAVARGNARVISDGKDLKADVIVAYLKRDKAGKSSIRRVEAFDNVEVETKSEKATSERGIYVVKTGIATLTGSVMIVRDENQLNGCKAEVNMNTGISRLFSCVGVGGGQVGGVFNLGKKKSQGN